MLTFFTKKIIWSYSTYAQKPPTNTRAGEFSGAKGIKFGLSLQLHSYFVYASRKGLGESRYMGRLA